MFKTRSITWFKEIPSTNSLLLEMIKTNPNLEDGTVIATHAQTAGRGRRNRVWLSAPGKNIAFSMLIKANPIRKIASLPLTLTLAVHELLQSLNLESQIKWPNDVLCSKKKICGILLETISLPVADTHACVAGIGLNINMDRDDCHKIQKPATSVLLETGKKYVPEELLENLLTLIPKWVNLWLEYGFADIRNRFQSIALPAGSAVSISSDQKTITGKLAGYGEYGQLILKTANGVTREFWSGEIVLCPEHKGD